MAAAGPPHVRLRITQHTFAGPPLTDPGTELIRRIGLSLGADVCWPLCYQHIMKRLDLRIPQGRDTIRFQLEPLTIEPFSLRQPKRYDLVIDRLTHWYSTRREWIKKACLMDGLYVFNNPWSVQAYEKHSAYCAMMRLGMPIPETWLVPPKEYLEVPDLRHTLNAYAKLFDLGDVGKEVGYPAYMKPYDGGGWRSVTKVHDDDGVRAAYEESGTSVMHIQQAVEEHDAFVRCIGFGPDVRFVRFDAHAPMHDRYTLDTAFLSDADAEHLRRVTLTINTFFGWEFNSCEALRAPTGVWHPIDFANPCPDSQVTSLHYHFPWVVKAYIRWSVFCAATARPMRLNLNWQPYFDIAAGAGSYEEKLEAYGRHADAVLETERFEEFTAAHLSHLDEVAWEFFGSAAAEDAVRRKVTALYPADEHDEFTALFWGRIQQWRADNTP